MGDPNSLGISRVGLESGTGVLPECDNSVPLLVSWRKSNQTPCGPLYFMGFSSFGGEFVVERPSLGLVLEILV
jgi:hypothetical protein